MDAVGPSSSNTTCLPESYDEMEEAPKFYVTDLAHRLDDLAHQLMALSPNDPYPKEYFPSAKAHEINMFKSSAERAFASTNQSEKERICSLRLEALCALVRHSRPYVEHITMSPSQESINLTKKTLSMREHIAVFDQENPPNTPLPLALKKEWKDCYAIFQDLEHARNKHLTQILEIITRVCLKQIQVAAEEYTTLRENFAKNYITNLNLFARNADKVEMVFIHTIIDKNFQSHQKCLMEDKQDIDAERQKKGEKEGEDRTTLESSRYRLKPFLEFCDVIEALRKANSIYSMPLF